MTDRQWREAWEIYRAARELSSEEQRMYAARASADPEVLEEVQSLLEGRDAEEAQAPELKPGTRIGRYEIAGTLGRGGMGVVYTARDDDLGRFIALKLLAPDAVPTRAAMDRLVREARAASALSHPHIVTVYEVVRSDAGVGIAMELVEGESLARYCETPQPASRAIAWTRQIAQALAAAHARNIIHRDIKPENVIVRSDGYIKVLDFGIARRLPGEDLAPSGTASGLLAGTLNYMSPEQTRWQPATGASDIFSLGVVLYQLLTGVHPFLRDSPIDTAHQIAHAEPKPPAALNRSVGSDLSALALRMLASDPARRPCAAEVDRALAAIESGALRRSPDRQSIPASFVAVFVAGTAAVWLLHARLFPDKEPEMTQVTRQASENRVTAAALSPDGAQLAFAVRGGPVHLRRMSDGLTRPVKTPPGLQVDRIVWFSDGSRLLISGSPSSHDGIGASGGGIWVMRVNGESSLVVANGKDGAPSPDGKQIAFTTSNGSMVWVTPITGGMARPVQAGGPATLFSSLIWSPDGKRLAWQRQEYAPAHGDEVNRSSTLLEKNYQFSYESVDVATRRRVAFARNVVMKSACALPDGRVLYLSWISLELSFCHQVWELRTDPVSGRLLGAPHRLTSNQDTTLSSISASGDGSEIAVVRSTEQPNVYVADLQSTGAAPVFRNLRRLTFAEADEYPHAWTGDSRAVIFESDRSGHYRIYRQNLDQTEAESLSAAQGVLPQISADRKWVMYRSEPKPGDRKLLRSPIDGGKAEPVPLQQSLDEFRCALRPGAACVLRSTENDQFVFYELDPIRGKGRELARTAWSPTVTADWDVSPDGSEIAIPNHDPDGANIRLVKLSGRRGSEERTIALNGLKSLNGVTWTADGKGWYISVRTTVGHRLYYADLAGHTSEMQVESMLPMYVAPSPDGHRAAFPGQTVSSNVWIFSTAERHPRRD